MNRYSKNIFAAISATLLSGIMWFLATGYIDFIDTDKNGEIYWVSEMIALLEGQHRFGLVTYTHCPIFPAYLLLPLLKLGVHSMDTLRLMPITLSALALGFFSFALIRQAKQSLPVSWAVIFPLVFLFQPGFLFWSGALCQQSYSFSIFLVAIGWCLIQDRMNYWSSVGLGFVASWISYDYLLMSLFGVFTVRWFMHNRARSLSLKEAFYLTLRDGSAFGVGMVAGILSHVLQVWLFHGSFKLMLEDLIGASYARMAIVPDEARFPTVNDSINPFIVSKDMMRWFINIYIGVPGSHKKSIPAYAYLNVLFAAVFISGFLSVYGFVKARKALEFEPDRNFRYWLLLAGGIVGILLVCFASIFVFPQSSRIHQFHLPRTFLAGFVLLGCLPILTERFQGMTYEVKMGPAFLRRQIIYPSLGALLLLLSVYGFYLLLM